MSNVLNGIILSELESSLPLHEAEHRKYITRRRTTRRVSRISAKHSRVSGVQSRDHLDTMFNYHDDN